MSYPETGFEATRDETTTAVNIAIDLPVRRRNYLLHSLLFLLTFASTTFSALIYFAPVPSISWDNLLAHIPTGLSFSIPLMVFLSAHEFGHYFAARYHRVEATLPFYIPMPPMLFGTMGAVIRVRSPIMNRRALFDIGVAGPLAGFVVALVYLIAGTLTLPGIESLYAIHPEYRALPSIPDYGFHFGGFLLLDLIRATLIAPGAFFPPMNEIYHYPLLCMGWFGMFVTALNLIPVGQLDGGHILYAMYGRYQPMISRLFVGFLVFAGLGTAGGLLLDVVRDVDANPLVRSVFGPPMEWIARHASWWLRGWMGWLLWAAIARFFVKIKHPPVPDETPLDPLRMTIGWIAFAILLLTFAFAGIYEAGA